MSTEVEDPARYVQLDINSSITSGFAALLLDVILLMIIKAQAQSLCSTANVYFIYDKRAPVLPVVSRLGFLTGAPVGPPNLSRFFSLLIAIATACVIVIGFAIDGKTVHTYKTQVYPAVIQVTGRPAQIDYDREYEFRPAPSKSESNDSLVFISRRLAAISDAYTCLDNRFHNATMYGYGFKEDLSGEFVDVRNKLLGGICIKEPRFKKAVISREYDLSQPGPPIGTDCVVKAVDPDFANDGDSQGTGTFTFGECDFTVKHVSCFRSKQSDGSMQTACAGIGRRSKPTKKAYILLVPNEKNVEDIKMSGTPSDLKEEDEAKVAMNVAFFSVVGIGGYTAANLANMARTTIQYDEPLLESDGDKEVSVVDMRIMKPLLIFIGVVAVVLMLATGVCWYQVVYRKGRVRYNTFTTIPEVMQLSNEERDRKISRTWKSNIHIGIGKDAPKIVVASSGTRGKCHGSEWKENEVDAEVWPEGREDSSDYGVFSA